MDGRRFVLTSLGGALAAPLATEAQPKSGKVYKVGVIVSTGSAADVSGPNPRHQNVTALLRGLRELVQ